MSCAHRLPAQSRLASGIVWLLIQAGYFPPTQLPKKEVAVFYYKIQMISTPGFLPQGAAAVVLLIL